MYNNYEYVMTADGELYHYGVKGMKWGHRKKLPESDIARNVRETKQAAKSAKKAYNKADTANKAQDAYKAAKKARKDAIKSTTRDLNKKATLGEKLTYNNATRKKAAKYIVDNNMSVADATKKAKGDAWRNTALMVAGYGALTVASLYANR